VCGAGGFIGGHLVKKLKREGYWVRGVDNKEHEYCPSAADEFVLLDLRRQQDCQTALTISGGKLDEVYQLAADMGGMGFIHSAECEIMHNSALINIYMTNMNGRIYGSAATSGRFLSPDPFIQYPEFSQSLNRYSYVMNNPLSFVDPSGFDQCQPPDCTELPPMIVTPEPNYPAPLYNNPEFGDGGGNGGGGGNAATACTSS